MSETIATRLREAVESAKARFDYSLATLLMVTLDELERQEIRIKQVSESRFITSEAKR